MLCDFIILPVSLAVPEAAFTPRSCQERVLLRPPCVLCSWGGLRGNVSWCLQKSSLAVWCPEPQQPSCSRSSACISVLRGVLNLRSPGRGRHRALFWPEERCDHRLLGWVWRKRDTCKHLNCTWGRCLLFCAPMAAKKTCKEMQGKHCCHRALAFPTQSPLQQHWPQFQGVCLGKSRTWVYAGEILLGGQRSWRSVSHLKVSSGAPPHSPPQTCISSKAAHVQI